MHASPSPISNFPSARMSEPQKYLTLLHEKSNFEFRLHRNHDMFLANLHWEAMGELERLFAETQKGTLFLSSFNLF